MNSPDKESLLKPDAESQDSQAEQALPSTIEPSAVLTDIPKPFDEAFSDDNLSCSEEELDDDLLDLFRHSAKHAPKNEELLTLVQGQIRQKTHGQYFDDGWSTRQEAPIETYLLSALLMLAVTFIFFLLIVPLSGPVKAKHVSPNAVQLVTPWVGQGK